jgi:hypothetical protein
MLIGAAPDDDVADLEYVKALVAQFPGDRVGKFEINLAVTCGVGDGQDLLTIGLAV